MANEREPAKEQLLEAPDLAFWEARSEEERKTQVEQVDADVTQGLSDWLREAQAYRSVAEAAQTYSRVWRIVLTGISGLVSLINIFLSAELTNPHHSWSVAAAVVAVISTILTSLSRDAAHASQAARARRARLILLDVRNTFDAKLRLFLHPFGHSPQACENALTIYAQFSAAKSEVRAKIEAELSGSEGEDKSGD